MEPIIIEGTPKTPTVKFDSTEGLKLKDVQFLKTQLNSTNL
jgi:hypothetical protein